MKTLSVYLQELPKDLLDIIFDYVKCDILYSVHQELRYLFYKCPRAYILKHIKDDPRLADWPKEYHTTHYQTYVSDYCHTMYYTYRKTIKEDVLIRFHSLRAKLKNKNYEHILPKRFNIYRFIRYSEDENVVPEGDKYICLLCYRNENKYTKEYCTRTFKSAKKHRLTKTHKKKLSLGK